MRKKIIILIIVIFVILALVGIFLLKNVFFCPAMYTNNSSFDMQTNIKIKVLILNSIKDYCSSLYVVNKDEIYDENYAEYIIQYDDSTKEKKAVSIIDFNFMNTARVTGDNEYTFTVTHYNWDYFLYYYVTIKEINGIYKIISFSVDI